MKRLVTCGSNAHARAGEDIVPFLSGPTVSNQSGSPFGRRRALSSAPLPVCEVDVTTPEMTTVLWSAGTRRTALVVTVAWLLAGTLDIATAVLYYAGLSSARAARLLQGIASGVLGARAFDGGAATALLGLALHYLIALIWTLVFLVAFRTLGVLRRHLVPVGIAYGIIVWLVMNLVVLPLSNVSRGPLQLRAAAIATIFLILCIGLPISLVIGRYLRGEDAT